MQERLLLAVLAALIAVPFLLFGPAVQAGELRGEIEARGFLRCGIRAPFSSDFPNSGIRRFQEDFCHSLAIALFRDRTAVEIIALRPGRARQSLRSGLVDVVALADPPAIGEPFRQAAPFFINSAAVLALRGERVPEALQGKRLCTLKAGDNLSRLAVFGQRHGLSLSVYSYDEAEELLDAARGNKCGAVSLPRLQLMALREDLTGKFRDMHWHEVPPSRWVLGPLVSNDDRDWLNIVRWLSYGLMEAELQGLSREDVDVIASQTRNPAILRLLGVEGELGFSLGLDRQWLYRVLKSYGNYGEFYERSFGGSSDLVLPRGPNALARDGGLLQSAPLQ